MTPLALDEFNGPRGDFYKNMFAKCPAGRPGTADEIANVAELLMSHISFVAHVSNTEDTTKEGKMLIQNLSKMDFQDKNLDDTYLSLIIIFLLLLTI